MQMAAQAPSEAPGYLIDYELLIYSFYDYRFERGKWRGKLYLPSNGTSWTSSAEVKNGELRIRGFIVPN